MSDDAKFDGSVPEFYEQYLVPLIFEPYAADLTSRVDGSSAQSVLEVACGTGVVTRALAAGLGSGVSITASDLSQPMVDHAAGVGTAREVLWRQGNVMDLPFESDSFDAVVCQFGVMFFADRPKAFAEIRRVLQPGGMFLFNTWDRLQANEFADVVADAAASVFPDDPPGFLGRTPYGYFDHGDIRDDLLAAGFEGGAEINVLEARSYASSADQPAIAFCHGTPLRNEIESRDRSLLTHVTSIATARIAERFGETDVDGLIRGFVITARTT
jgi:SAM-dependent methyltransferase